MDTRRIECVAREEALRTNMDRSNLQLPPLTLPKVQDIFLHGFSYEERRQILPLILDIVSSGGCWLKERRMTSFSHVEFVFEMQLRSALEIYSALIATGLELTESSHAELTRFWTIGKNNHALHERRGRVLCVRLDIRFTEETDFDSGWNIAGEA